MGCNLPSLHDLSASTTPRHLSHPGHKLTHHLCSFHLLNRDWTHFHIVHEFENKSRILNSPTLGYSPCIYSIRCFYLFCPAPKHQGKLLVCENVLGIKHDSDSDITYNFGSTSQAWLHAVVLWVKSEMSDTIIGAEITYHNSNLSLIPASYIGCGGPVFTGLWFYKQW